MFTAAAPPPIPKLEPDEEPLQKISDDAAVRGLTQAPAGAALDGAKTVDGLRAH